MATEDYDDEFEFIVPEQAQQEYLYGLIGFHNDAQDQEVHDLFWQLMYNNELSLRERMDVYDDLSDRLRDEYDLDFGQLWDWEDFREWYAAS